MTILASHKGGVTVSRKALQYLFLIVLILSNCSTSRRYSDAFDATVLDGSRIQEVVMFIPVESECGNGLLENGEVCDDGNTEDGDTCDSECLFMNICPNGAMEGSLEIPNRSNIGLEKLSPCKKIIGDLKLMGGDLGRLGQLDIETIEGNLFIGNPNEHNPYGAFSDCAIEGLDGLRDLTSVGGDFIIINNYELTSLEGLNRLKSIGGNFIIDSNDTLSSLAGLDHLTTIGGDFVISGNHFRSVLTGPKELSTIGGNLIIGPNSLTDVEAEVFANPSYEMVGPFELKGFEGLKQIGGDLNIHGSYGLKELNAFEQLEWVGGSVEISNSFLVEMRIFDHSMTIEKDLIIVYNNELEVLSFPADPLEIGGDIHIKGNEMLPTCDALSFTESVRKSGNTGKNIVCENLEDSCHSKPCPEELPSE